MYKINEQNELSKKFAKDLFEWLNSEGVMEVTPNNKDSAIDAIELTLINYSKFLFEKLEDSKDK